jgi:hypothetical protein
MKHIPMEEELLTFLICGYSITMFLSFTFVLVILKRSKHNKKWFPWIIIHLISNSISIYLLFRVFTFNIDNSMASEEISLLLGGSMLSWIVGMFSLLASVYKLSK